MASILDWRMTIDKKRGLYKWEVYSWRTAQVERGASATLPDAKKAALEALQEMMQVTGVTR